MTGRAAACRARTARRRSEPSARRATCSRRRFIRVEAEDAGEVREDLAVGVKRMGVSGHDSVPLHEYGVYAVNPIFGPALPVVGASQQYSTYVCQASLVLARCALAGRWH